MATYWDPMWDDEENLKAKSTVELYRIFLAAETDSAKIDKVKAAMKAKMANLDSIDEANSYELLSYLNVFGNDDETLKTLDSSKTVDQIKKEIVNKIDDL